MEIQRVSHGWSGSIRQFLDAPPENVQSSLEEHLRGLLGRGAAGTQLSAWEEEIQILRQTFRDLSIARQDILTWSVILEFELPLEGGRRPDVIVLGPSTLFILEFKQDHVVSQSAMDQVAAYSRDLSEYHSATHGKKTIPIVVPTRSSDVISNEDNVYVASKDNISKILNSAPQELAIDLKEWLAGDYQPLPTLIAAARMIFAHEDLPRIKRHESLGVGKAVHALRKIAQDTKMKGKKSLAFVSGVPGAGKTLVGLQFVYESSDDIETSVFLSGNGPLVEVLRDALKSKVFVRDLHAFIKSYGNTSKIPKQNIVVFDEAQRAWDSGYMSHKGKGTSSEPTLLIDIGNRIKPWSVLVGLIGHGQEINSGEEAGMDGWAESLRNSGSKDWQLFIPPRHKQHFEDFDYELVNELDLTVSLRTRQAEYLHQWVELMLNGKLAEASKLATSMRLSSYPIHITRDLELAKEYVRELYSDMSEKRYGIIASSKDRILNKYGIKNGFQDTSRVKKSAWFNRGLESPESCCSFRDTITEFDCQGLELDMAIVAWGNDFLWTGTEWKHRIVRTKYPQRKGDQIRLNSYRVLLTRSRDGVVIYLPPEEILDRTEEALLAAGARYLEPQLKLEAI